MVGASGFGEGEEGITAGGGHPGHLETSENTSEHLRTHLPDTRLECSCVESGWAGGVGRVWRRCGVGVV